MADQVTIDVDPEGDVILVCGSQEVQKLRVHSKVLALSSKAFKVLLSPYFREGAQLASTSTVEIPLPNDSAEGMRILCCVLHHRNDDVPKWLSPVQVLTIAMLTDKYDCMQATKHVAELWIQELRYCEDLHRHTLIAATFYFQIESLWPHVCKDFIYECVRTFKRLPNFDHAPALERLCDVLEHTKEQLYERVTRGIADLIREPQNWRCSTIIECDTIAEYLYWLTSSLNDSGILTSGQRGQCTLDHLSYHLHVFEAKASRSSGRNYHETSADNAELSQRKEQARSALQHLAHATEDFRVPCLLCALSGPAQGGDESCTHHQQAFPPCWSGGYHVG